MGRKRKINDLELIYLHGLGLTQQQIADKLDVNRTTVTLAIGKLKKEYPELLESEDLEEFRNRESDHLGELRKMLLFALKQKVMKMDLKNISFQQLSTLYGTIFDKDRLLRGEATEHVAHANVHQLSDEDRALLKSTIGEMTKRALLTSSEEALDEMAEHSESGDSEEDQ